ncbi:MAG: DUF58 domain-containing protein [Bacteroidota bacterium]|nr:DUF58 domain-containing protein [Bacteroidota bacterium]
MSVDLEKLDGYSSLEFRANKRVEGFIAGLHRSPFHGFSVEFADYRPYNVGEDTKYMDWKLFARTDKLFLKNYEQETNLRCLLVLDHSSSMYFPFDRQKANLEIYNKMSFAVVSMATLVSMLYRQRDAFGLALLSDKIDFISDIKSNLAHKKYIFTLLEQIYSQKVEQTKPITRLSPLLHRLAEQTHKRSLVVIFTDLFSQTDTPQDIINALQHLKYNKHEVILFHCIDKKLEEKLLYKNRPYRFVDVESREEIKLNPVEIREIYNREVGQKFNYIKQTCLNMAIDYVECDINKSLNQVLLPYFLKRIRLK